MTDDEIIAIYDRHHDQYGGMGLLRFAREVEAAARADERERCEKAAADEILTMNSRYADTFNEGVHAACDAIRALTGDGK